MFTFPGQYNTTIAEQTTTFTPKLKTPNSLKLEMFCKTFIYNNMYPLKNCVLLSKYSVP